MNCCICKKKVDLRSGLKNEQAQWYGKYKGDVCIKVICDECIRDPKKKEIYRR